MKKIYFLFFLFLFYYLPANTQINTGILPESFKTNFENSGIDNINLYPPDLDLIRQEDEIGDKNGEMMKVARLIPFSANVDNSGTWDISPNGKNIWRLKISSEGAKACVLHFDDFKLPKGAELFVYNPDRSVVLGPYTSADNDDGGSYAIGIIYGSELIVEYIAPLLKSINGQNEAQKPILEMASFSYFYRGVELFDYRGTGYTELLEVVWLTQIVLKAVIGGINKKVLQEFML